MKTQTSIDLSMTLEMPQPSESDLEDAMRQEFFGKPSSSMDSIIIHKDEQSPGADDSILVELERVMTQELFSQYVYRSFEAENKNSIRLFQLKPGSRNDPIEGRLVFVSLDSNPDYEALSYAWGGSETNHSILTDEGVIPMTASVRSALTRLRLLDRTRVLWIDALCINQKDNKEKSGQILLMPKIYSSASRVVVYLGEESDGSELAIKLIQKIARTSFHSISGYFVSDHILKRLGLPTSRAKIWKYFRAFWARSWFRRIWVIQEFVLAKDITMVCGEWQGSWEIFLEASTKISDLSLMNLSSDYQMGDLRTSLDSLKASVGSMLMVMMCLKRVEVDQGEYRVHRLTTLLEMGDMTLKEAEVGPLYVVMMASLIRSNPNIRRDFSRLRQNDTFDKFAYFGVLRQQTSPREIPRAPLLKLIGMAGAAEATEPKDRLYALLSLASDLDEEEVQFLRPDYRECVSVKSVVCRYASVLVRKGHTMDILYEAFLEPGPYNLPSWASNWIIPDLPISNKAHMAQTKPRIYKAGGYSNPKANIGDMEDVLVVSGGLIDTIDSVGLGPVIPRTAGPLVPMIAESVLKNADAIFETLETYPTGETIFEVKWRTMIANKTHTGKKEPPEQYGDLYLAWREQIREHSFAWAYAESLPKTHEEYFYALCRVSNHKFCKTRRGYVGLVPTSAEVGDRISVLVGGIVPFVLRDSAERPGMFRMVGGCYIHGIMKGEALTFLHWKEKSLKLH